MNNRRYDLDWLRIAAFAILILYHVGMFYVSWDWHVKSSRASEAIEPLMQLVNPWRLTLLFLISGAATRFMADKMSAGAFTLSRMGRLWPPLLLAVFVIVPPQAYYEVYEGLEAMSRIEPADDPWLADFYVKYVTASGDWCDADGCLVTPTYNHMWFVAYLILYTLALVLLLPLLRRAPKLLARLIAGPGLFLTPWLIMTALRATLFPVFGETHDFRVDWYLHALYFSVFLFGFAVAKHQAFFDAAVRARWLALVGAVAAWAALRTADAFISDSAELPDWGYIALRATREAQAWGAILAVIGFAHRHLRDLDNPLRRTLTHAIFPFYLVHQTIIVVAGHHLDALALPLALEAVLLISLTLLGCWGFYEAARRMGPLRIWAGLAPAAMAPQRRNSHVTGTGD